VGESEPSQSAGPKGRRLAFSTAIFAAITGVSRVLGLVREIVSRRTFGVEGEINAFTVAFQVPNLVRALAADTALSSAFVPVFSELLEKDQRARAWRVASTLFWLVLIVLGAVTALLMLLAPLIMRLFGLGDLEELATTLSRILFPVVVLMGVSGIVVGILNSYEEFTVQALMPVIWNVAIIVSLVVVVPRFESEEAQLYVYAGGVLVGTVLQTITPVWWLRGRDGRIRAVLDLRDPAVKRVLTLMLPVALGIGLINFNLVVNTFFASRFVDPQLAPSAIDAAFRIYMLPQGMFSVAVATVLFPRLSRLAARADLVGFRETVSLGVRQIGFLLLPASAVAAVLAEPIVRLLYQRGEFTAEQTPVVAGALAAFALGLTFNGTMLMLNRSFFSLQSPWVPTAIALGNLVLNAVLAGLLYRVGVWGIPLATSFVNIAGTLALLAVLRRRLGRLDGRAIAASYGRIAVAPALAATAAFGCT
jgi:putative peptidoglycan lipid II flippase